MNEAGASMSFNGWEYLTLEDVVERLTNGYVGPTRNIYRDTGVPYLLARQVRDNHLEFDGKTFVSDEFNIKNKKSMLKEGDVLLVQSGHIGHCAVVPASHADHNCHAMIVITPVAKYLTGEFLSLFFNSPFMKSKFTEIRSGSTVPHLTCKAVRKLQIPVPPLAEQKRIVAILDEAFGAIAKAKENAEKNLANAKELFESYLNRVFSEKGEGWEETTVGEICSSVEYGTSSKSQPIGDVPVLRMGNIQNREIDWSDLVYANNSEEVTKYSLCEGDVLFNRTNSAAHVGKTCVYRGERPAIFAGYLIRIHYDRDRVDGEYLNYYLNSDEARDYGKTVMSRSVNQANINGTKLKDYRFPLAPLSEQRMIVARFNALRNETNSVETLYDRKLADLDELKQSILQKAFTGQLTSKSTELQSI